MLFRSGKNTGVGCHFPLHCVKAKSESEVAQSHPTRSNPMDCSLPGSSIHGIFQARVLEWGAIVYFPSYLFLFAKGSLGWLGNGMKSLITLPELQDLC